MANRSRISVPFACACLGLVPALAQGWQGEPRGTGALPIVRHGEGPADLDSDPIPGLGAGGWNAAVDPTHYDPAQGESFRNLLKDLHTPRYGWFYGLDAALGSWKIRVMDGMAPPAFRVHRAMDPACWRITEDPAEMDIRETFLYTDRLGAWLKSATGKEVKGEAPAAIITPAVVVTHGQAVVDIPRKRAVTAFVRTVAARNGALKVYLPIDATSPDGRDRHYILAVARLEQGGAAGNSARAGGRSYVLDLKFHDSLMSGRFKWFTLDDQDRLSRALAQGLGQWLGGLATVEYQLPSGEPGRNARLLEAYHQVRSQMPGTKHCGRYATLYLFADLMGVPYSDWYQERFNRVLPTFIDTFEPHLKN